jgi:hypothetical protein
MLLERAVPLAFLYMLHPHRPVSIAAQEVIKSTISTVPIDTSEQLAAYFITRCLEGYPTIIDAQQISQGLDHVLRVLPSTSAVSLNCLEDVLSWCLGMYDSARPSTRGIEEADKLFTAAAVQIMAIPYPLLSQTTALFEQFVRKMEFLSVEGKAMSVILAVISNSDDCVRKPELAAWYQKLCS